MEEESNNKICDDKVSIVVDFGNEYKKTYISVIVVRKLEFKKIGKRKQYETIIRNYK